MQLGKQNASLMTQALQRLDDILSGLKTNCFHLLDEMDDTDWGEGGTRCHYTLTWCLHRCIVAAFGEPAVKKVIAPFTRKKQLMCPHTHMLQSSRVRHSLLDLATSTRQNKLKN